MSSLSVSYKLCYVGSKLGSSSIEFYILVWYTLMKSSLMVDTDNEEITCFTK